MEVAHLQFDRFRHWNTVSALGLHCCTGVSAEHLFLQFIMLAVFALFSIGDENMAEKG